MSCCILNTLLLLEFLGVGGIQSTINTFSLSNLLVLPSITLAMNDHTPTCWKWSFQRFDMRI